MFPALFSSKKSKDQPSPSKKDKEDSTSILASIVTPQGKWNNVKKPKKSVVVKSHTRNARKTKRPTNISSNIIKVGTIVSRSFKTWPRSRKPGDPPVPEIFQGMVT